jgi:pimeloyl-ACP methyl ester carboxylesterase
MYVDTDMMLIGPAGGLARPRADIIEAGAGPLVVLVHASMAGVQQWKPLIAELETQFLVRAVNLFGYGRTPAWNAGRDASLDDFAALVLQAVPPKGDVRLVGHSLGGAVALHAATLLGPRVRDLILIEPSLFSLLDGTGDLAAFDEIRSLARLTTGEHALLAPEQAAAAFIDYWSGAGAWDASSARTKAAVLNGLPRLQQEWAALLNGGGTRPGDWTASIRAQTLLLTFAETVRPSRAIVQLLSEAAPAWAVATLGEGGHMAPVTHPHLVNPIIRGVLVRAQEPGFGGPVRPHTKI